MERTLLFVIALVVTPVGVDARKWYLLVLRKYAVFSGRSQRMEFWMFTLVHTIIYLGLTFIEVLSFDSGQEDPILSAIYTWGVLIPTIAVSVRRLHDTDHSGWWTIVPFVSFYFWCIDGTSGDNRFGPDPKKVAIGPTKANLIPDSPIYRDSPPPADVTVSIASPETEAQPEPQLWRYCEDCGGKVAKRLTACSHCGCPVEPKVACPDCGENFVASLAACPVCGGPTARP